MKHTPLHDRLKGPIRDDLKKDLKVDNVHALPQVEKVVISTGINKMKMDSKEMRAYIEECLGLITGQKPVFTTARKAISNFKTRSGNIVGSMVTLRGRKATEFLDRLISYTLPRIRDFRGLSTKLDGKGNYSLGLRDHSIFPEIPPTDAKQIFGLQIQIKMTGESDEASKLLLKKMGMPLRAEKTEEAKEAEDKKEAKDSSASLDSSASSASSEGEKPADPVAESSDTPDT